MNLLLYLLLSNNIYIYISSMKIFNYKMYDNPTKIRHTCVPRFGKMIKRRGMMNRPNWQPLNGYPYL